MIFMENGRLSLTFAGIQDMMNVLGVKKAVCSEGQIFFMPFRFFPPWEPAERKGSFLFPRCPV